VFVSDGWIAACAPGRTPAELADKTGFDVFSDEHASTAFNDEQQIIRTGEPVVGMVGRETYRGRVDVTLAAETGDGQGQRARVARINTELSPHHPIDEWDTKSYDLVTRGRPWPPRKRGQPPSCTTV
jgi:hypothetical protein